MVQTYTCTVKDKPPMASQSLIQPIRRGMANLNGWITNDILIRIKSKVGHKVNDKIAMLIAENFIT